LEKELPQLRQILFNDITLRDGEQSPGVHFQPEEKVKIAQKLALLNVPIIEAGFAVASEADFEGVKRVAETVGGEGGPIICSMCRAHRKDIDAAYEALRSAHRPRIQIVIATSDLHMEHKLRMSREQVLERIKDTVSYARGLVDQVEFAAEDATRSDISFLHKAFEVAIKSGASIVEIPDTVGYATPIEYGNLVKSVMKNVPGGKDVTIATHCHDDLGLAVANTLFGLAAGANQAECTINGIGERAGNASFEEVCMAIRTRSQQWGVSHEINTPHLKEISNMVRDLSGMAIAPNKAIVGRNAFLHESGIHQHGMLVNSETYQILDPKSVGVDNFSLILGKLSGKHSLKQKIAEWGYDLSESDFNKLYDAFKVTASRKKVLVDDDILSLIKHIVG
jgi:2-isopropylmalate synthase